MPVSVWRIVGREVLHGVRSGGYIAKGEYLKRSDALIELRHQLLVEHSREPFSKSIPAALQRIDRELHLALAEERPTDGSPRQ